MAYQLPKVERIDQAASPSVGRLQVEAPNVTGAIEAQNKGFQNLASKAVDIENTYEYQLREKELTAADIKATELNNGYETLYKSELAKIKEMKGDTTEAYRTLETNKKQWQSDLANKSKDYSSDVQTYLGQKLSATNARMFQDQTVQQSTQNFVYSQQVHKETVKLRQDSMMNYAQTLSVQNPNSFTAFKAQVDSIVAENSKNAYANGLAKKDENGNITELSPAALNQIKADVGDGMVNVVKVLNNAGRVKEAKKLIEDYSDYLNAKDKEKLLADNSEGNVKNLALDAVSKLKAPSGKAAIDEINNNKELSEAVKYKAKEIIDTNDRRGEYANKRKQDDTYNRAYEYVKQRQSGKQPFLTTAQMRDDPVWKEAVQNMNPNQKKALEDMVVSPKESDPKAKENIQKLFQTGQLGTLKPAELNEKLALLSKEDRTRWEGAWKDLQKKPKKGSGEMSESARRERMNYMNKALFDDAQLFGAIPKSGAPETWNDKDKAYYAKMVDGFADFARQRVGDNVKDPSTQKTLVREYLRGFMKNEPQPEKGFFQNLFGTGRKATIPPPLGARAGIGSDDSDTLGPRPERVKGATKNLDIGNMSPAELKNWRNEYFKETGMTSISDTAAFQNWINKQASKK